MIRFLVILIFTCVCNYSLAQVNIITTIAGDDSEGFRGDGGPAIYALLNHAGQLCVDKFENIYISDAFNNRIRKIDLITGIITTVAGNGTGGYTGDNIPATDAELWIPQAVCIDTSGNIYIGDPFNYRIRKVTVSSGIISTIAGNGIPGNSGDGSAATDAQIMTPAGLTIDNFDNIYLADIGNNNIRKINTLGIITTVAGNGTLGYSGDGGPATDAQFNSPGDMAVDSSGNIFISDCYNNVLREVNYTSGIVTTVAGNGTAGYSGDGGSASNSKLSFPYGIYIDKHSNIIFVDGDNGAIRKIDGSTSIITTIAGSGSIGFSGDGGPATNAKLSPDDVYLDKNGIMYIADYGNNRIRKVYNDKLTISNISLGNEIIIYPNPAKDELTIENAAGSGMKLVNILGEELYSLKIISNHEDINIRNLVNGNYILKIVDEHGSVQKRILVKD